MISRPVTHRCRGPVTHGDHCRIRSVPSRRRERSGQRAVSRFLRRIARTRNRHRVPARRLGLVAPVRSRPQHLVTASSTLLLHRAGHRRRSGRRAVHRPPKDRRRSANRTPASRSASARSRASIWARSVGDDALGLGQALLGLPQPASCSAPRAGWPARRRRRRGPRRPRAAARARPPHNPQAPVRRRRRGHPARCPRSMAQRTAQPQGSRSSTSSAVGRFGAGIGWIRCGHASSSRRRDARRNCLPGQDRADHAGTLDRGDALGVELVTLHVLVADRNRLACRRFRPRHRHDVGRWFGHRQLVADPLS